MGRTPLREGCAVRGADGHAGERARAARPSRIVPLKRQ